MTLKPATDIQIQYEYSECIIDYLCSAACKRERGNLHERQRKNMMMFPPAACKLAPQGKLPNQPFLRGGPDANFH